MTQISLSVPEPLLGRLRERTRQQGFRSVQEQILQMIRDQFFLDNLERYKRIDAEMRAGKKTTMSIKEFHAWSQGLRSGTTRKSFGKRT